MLLPCWYLILGPVIFGSIQLSKFWNLLLFQNSVLRAFCTCFISILRIFAMLIQSHLLLSGCYFYLRMMCYNQGSAQLTFWCCELFFLYLVFLPSLCAIVVLQKIRGKSDDMFALWSHNKGKLFASLLCVFCLHMDFLLMPFTCEIYLSFFKSQFSRSSSLLLKNKLQCHQ